MEGDKSTRLQVKGAIVWLSNIKKASFGLFEEFAAAFKLLTDVAAWL